MSSRLTGLNSSTRRVKCSSGFRIPCSLNVAASSGEGCSTVVVMRTMIATTVIVPSAWAPAARGRIHQVPVTSAMIAPITTAPAKVPSSIGR